LTLGLTEDIITDLSKISGVRVLSRHAVEKFRNREFFLPAVAQELRVRYVLHGSLLSSGNSVEVTVKLYDHGSRKDVLSESHGSTLDQVFELQERVSQMVCSALELRLTEVEKRSVGHRRTRSAEAYECYLKGRQHYALQTAADNKIAEDFLANAIRKDSGFVAAIAALAEVYVQRYYNWFDRDRAWLTKAEEIILQAVEIDDQIPEVHCTLGMLLYLRGDYQQAMEEIQKAIRLDPHYAIAHDHSGEIYLHTGEIEKALLAFHTELRINPEVIYPYFYLVWIHSLVGDFRIAREVLEQAQRKHTANPLLNVLHGTFASYSGDLADAEKFLTQAIAINPGNSFATARLGVVYAEMENWPRAQEFSEKATERIDPSDHHAAFDRACVFALQKDRENTLLWLQRAVKLGWRCRYHYEHEKHLRGIDIGSIRSL